MLQQESQQICGTVSYNYFLNLHYIFISNSCQLFCQVTSNQVWSPIYFT